MNDSSTHIAWNSSHKVSWEAFKPWTTFKARAGGCGDRSILLLGLDDASKPMVEETLLAYMSIYASFDEIILDSIVKLWNSGLWQGSYLPRSCGLGETPLRVFLFTLTWLSAYSWVLKRKTYSISSSSSLSSILWRFLAFMRFLLACDKFGLK